VSLRVVALFAIFFSVLSCFCINFLNSFCLSPLIGVTGITVWRSG
jgi:hypothetical protein